MALDVSERVGITDIFLMCAGSNDRQVRAIVDAIEESLDEIDVDPLILPCHSLQHAEDAGDLLIKQNVTSLSEDEFSDLGSNPTVAKRPR